jgi:DNA excision repair protein ERCC-3
MPPKRKAALKAGTKKYGSQESDEDEYIQSIDDEYAHDDFIDDSEYNMPNKREKISSGKGKNVKSFQNANKHSSLSLNSMENSLICQDYSSILTLKPDHQNRPIWITKDNTIMLEAFSPCYKGAYDFLIDIAEPETRPEFIHTYRLTEDSLYAAVALALDTEKIIRQLNILCKTEIPKEVEKYIRDCTYTFGKAKLVLKDNNYCIESTSPDILRDLLRNPKILSARIFDIKSAALSTNITKSTSIINLTNTNKSNDGFIESTSRVEDKRNITTNIDLEDMDDDIDEENDLANNTLKTVIYIYIFILFISNYNNLI